MKGHSLYSVLESACVPFHALGAPAGSHAHATFAEARPSPATSLTLKPACVAYSKHWWTSAPVQYDAVPPHSASSPEQHEHDQSSRFALTSQPWDDGVQ